MPSKSFVALSAAVVAATLALVPTLRAADTQVAGDRSTPTLAPDDPRDMRPLAKYRGQAFKPPASERDVRPFSGPLPSTQEVPLDKVKRIPPAGVAVPAGDREELEKGVAQLAADIDKLKGDAKAAELLPDVQIYYNAVHYALKYDEFFDAGQIPKAKKLLTEGLERAKMLAEGKPAWTTATGLVVRGYVSKIDGSVQPYGLVIPPTLTADPAKKRRLDIWYHGRGETLNEINFLSDREKSPGQFTPADTIVLHPYGRYCNGNRFAGEVDTFEALADVKKHYAIDDNRILERGFSMGGAACWMMATHHATDWAAAAPGAGYSETADFLHITDLNAIPWYQRKMWGLYDSTTMAVNLFNLPVVAYSGELDGQKQAADEMVKACKAVGIEFPYVIGKGAHHNYTKEAIAELNKQLDAIAANGRDQFPAHVKFATYSLRYNTQAWVTIDALDHHWEQATIEVEIGKGNTITIATKNVAEFTLALPGRSSLLSEGTTNIVLNGAKMFGSTVDADRSWKETFFEVPNKPGQFGPPEAASSGAPPVTNSAKSSLHKRHDLQGPIDDAFMDSFIMVSPTGKPANEKAGEWIKHEEAHAIDAWRKQFRGEARVKDDSAITDADVRDNNLVLWGDPSSNAILAKIAGRLPIKWEAQAIAVADKSYPAADHVAVLIYPNPLNPKRYVVLNSGITFREYAYENNARQTPKLPDWAIIDINKPATAQTPGGIADANFFGENWELTSQKP